MIIFNELNSKISNGSHVYCFQCPPKELGKLLQKALDGYISDGYKGVELVVVSIIPTFEMLTVVYYARGKD